MKFQLEDITVYFPYTHIYPEQYAYMLELKRALDAGGHCVLEMPTGTGKTIALLSLIVSYSMSRPTSPTKLLYCTRTVHEMEKTLAELKLLHSHLLLHLPASTPPPFLALGLSSRKNLCVNPAVVAAESRDSVDAACRKLTASWVRALAAENPGVPTCEFFESYERAAAGAVLPAGVYTLQDLRTFGREKGWCPYFLARHMIQFANVVVYSYQYLLDPKVSSFFFYFFWIGLALFRVFCFDEYSYQYLLDSVGSLLLLEWIGLDWHCIVIFVGVDCVGVV